MDSKKQVSLFIIIGIVNTLVGTAIMFGLYNLAGASYWVSSITNYVLTSILSFFLNKRFTFQYRDNSIRAAVRFAANIIVCYIIAYGIAKPFAYEVLYSASEIVRDNIALFVGMVLFTVCNFVGQKYFAFKQQNRSR